MSKQKIDDLESLSKLYNPNSSKGELPNPNEQFISDEDDNENENEDMVDDDPDHIEDEDNPQDEEYIPQEVIQQMLSLPDEELTKLGIDDPKQWKNYQRAFTKERQKRQALEAQIAKLSNPNSDSKIAELERQINELKNSNGQSQKLERPQRPVRPKMPANYDPARSIEPGTAEYAYSQEMVMYNDKLAEYHELYEQYKEVQDSERIKSISAKAEANDLIIKNQNLKANMIAKLVKKNLTPAEANAAFEMALKPDFYDDELIALGYKVKMGKKFDRNSTPNKKKINKDKVFFPLGNGGGGNRDSKPRPGEFCNSKDTSSFYKITKQG